MNCDIKVLIIITTYNTSEYLRNCLDTIVGNTYKNIEIILVDDGSTDDSPEICREYAAMDSRIIYISQKNSGVSAARNNGLFRATGEYIHFVDGDDYVSHDFYEKIVGAIVRDKPDIVCCSVYNERGNFLDSPIPVMHMGLLGKLSVNEGLRKGAWGFIFGLRFCLVMMD